MSKEMTIRDKVSARALALELACRDFDVINADAIITTAKKFTDFILGDSNLPETDTSFENALNYFKRTIEENKKHETD